MGCGIPTEASMQTLSLCAFLSILALPATEASAADARPAKPEMKMNVPPYSINSQVFDFPTGLRIVMQSDRSHPVVTVYTMVNHGSSDDPKGREENAHFCEHAWFRSRHGTLPTIMELFNEIGDIGASVNASTHSDFTDFSTVASSEYLPLLLRLESLRLTEPYAGITEGEIDTEREVIRNEFRWHREDPRQQFFKYEYVMEALYPEDHPYHKASTHDSIDNLRLPDVQAFFDKFYKPDQTTITIVGDFDPADASSLIFANVAPQLLNAHLTAKDYFQYPRPGVAHPDQNNPNDWLTGAWDPDSPAGDKRQVFQFTPHTTPRVSENRPPPPPPASTDVVYRKDDVENTKVMVAWSLPGGFRDDRWDMLFLGSFASGIMGNGLGDEIRDHRVGRPDCGADEEALATTVLCEIDVMDDKLDPLQVRDKMLDQLSELWNPENYATDSPSAKYFNASITRNKMEFIAGQLLSIDMYANPYQGRALDIGHSAHLSNSETPQKDGINQIMALDPGVVSKLAQQYLTRQRAVTVVIKPQSADSVDVASEHSSYTGHESEGTMPLNAAIDLAKVDTAQIVSSYLKPDLTTLQDFELPNQMRVVIVKHGDAPLVQASLLFGNNYTTQSPLLFPFIATTTGANPNDPLQIAGQANWTFIPGNPDQPAQTYPMSGVDNAGNYLKMSLRVPGGDLEQALWILRDTVESEHPDLDGKDSWIKSEKDSLERQWKSSDWAVSHASREFLYPGVKYSQGMTWDDITAAKSWSSDTAQQFLDSVVQPQNATLVLVGNLDPEEAKKIALAQFGGWTARNPQAKPPSKKFELPPQPTEPSKILIFDQPNASQTSFRRFCRLNVTDPEQQRTAVSTLGSLVGGDVFKNMRVKEGLAYSPSAVAQQGVDGSASLIFFSDTVNAGVGRMIEYTDGLLKQVAAGQITNEELTLEKLRDARIDGLFSQSLDQVTDQLTTVVSRGQTWESLADHGKDIAAVSVDDLKGLMQGCGDHVITTLVGPKDVLVPELEERGYKYEVVNYKAQGDDLLWKYDPKQAKKNQKARQKSDAKKAKDDAKPKDPATGGT